VPGDNQWDVTLVNDGSFKVLFPSKADLDRLRKIKSIEFQDTPIKMFSEDCSKERWWTSRVYMKFGLEIRATQIIYVGIT
jgi:hypothetical protein